MKPSPRQLAALLAVFHLAAASLAAQVNLYASPESGAAQVGQVPDGDERLMLSAPVQDSAQANKGWMYITLDEEFKGYANAGDMDEFGAGDGLPIYAKPNDQSSLMTIAEAGERVDVGSREGSWHSVTVKKPLTVYYNEKGNPAGGATAAAAPRVPEETSQLGAGEPLAPAQATKPSRPSSPAPAPSQRGRVLDSSDPAIAAAMGNRTTVSDETTSPKPADTQAAPTKPTATAASEPESSGLATAPARRKSPAQPDKGAPSDLARSIEGVFREASGSWFSKPPYPYALFDNEGHRIAYVDVSGAMLSRPVVELEERRVSAYGVLQKADGNELVVKARLLTPQN